MRISISVDDASKNDIRIARLCEKYDVECIFYWPVDIIGLSMMKGWEPIAPQHEAYIAQNFEIGSHTITHRYLTQIPLDEAIDEIEQSKKILSEKYDQNVEKFCYPRGYANERLKQVVQNAGYKEARSTHIGHIGEPEDKYFAPSAVHMGCPVRAEYNGSTWYDYGISLLHKAKDEDKDFHAWMHSWEVNRYQEWKNVERFIKELSRG